jgi:glycosyl transferase family 25
MKIAVINLASEEARWAEVRRRFEAVGLQPEREEGVLGSALSASQRAALYCERLNGAQYHKPLRPGEIGCYASHIALWRGLLDSGRRSMAIFEDDIEIDEDLPAVLAAIARTPVDWDVVKLIGRSSEKVRTSLPLLPQRALIHYRRVPSLTGGYVLSRRGAEKLLARRPPFGRPVDVDIRHWWECELKVVGVHPYPIRGAAASRQSTIEDRAVRPDARMRLRKLLLQARYSLLNWHANHRVGDGIPSRSVGGLARLHDEPAGHDAR